MGVNLKNMERSLQTLYAACFSTFLRKLNEYYTTNALEEIARCHSFRVKRVHLTGVLLCEGNTVNLTSVKNTNALKPRKILMRDRKSQKLTTACGDNSHNTMLKAR